jgi:hypothetical protein
MVGRFEKNIAIFIIDIVTGSPGQVWNKVSVTTSQVPKMNAWRHGDDKRSFYLSISINKLSKS